MGKASALNFFWVLFVIASRGTAVFGFEFADQFAESVIRKKSRLVVEMDGGAGAGTVPAPFMFIKFIADTAFCPAEENYFVVIPEGIDTRFIGRAGDKEIDKIIFGPMNGHGERY